MVPIDPVIGSAAIGALGSIFNSAFSSGQSEEITARNMKRQYLYDQLIKQNDWQNYNSPKAQASALAQAGISPAAMVSGGSSFSSSSGGMPSSSQFSVNGMFDPVSISTFIKAIADAKKAGMDTNVAEQTAKNLQVDEALKKFELDLQQKFGKEFKSVELANAYRQLLLASDSHDLNVLEKALKEWSVESEKASSKAKGYEADMLKQMLDNNPTKIELENNLLREKAKTEQAGQAASYASAAESRERSITERDLRKSRLLSIDLENELKGLESDFNYQTFQKRLERFVNECGILNWSILTSEMEYKDRNAYNALQRLILGKGSKQDGVDVIKFLRNHSSDGIKVNK